MGISDTVVTRGYGRLPLSNIVPFTYRDGMTFADLLYSLRNYVTDDLHPDLAKNIDALTESLNKELADFGIEFDETQAGLTETVNGWSALFDGFKGDITGSLAPLNDAAIASLFGNAASETSKLLYGSFIRRNEFTVNALDYRPLASTGNKDSAWIQNAVNSVPDNTLLTFPRDMTFTLDVPVNINRAIDIQGGNFNASAVAFNITSSNVSLDRMTFTGPGIDAVYISKSATINVKGTAAAYLENVHINGCKITGIRDTGIQLEFVKDFTVTRNKIKTFKYAGIMLLSAEDGEASYNIVSDAYQPANLTNSYGIAVSDLINTVANRSRNVTVMFNQISNIPLWEGLDTHGGDNIVFAFNTVTECKNGIVITVGNNDRVTAPINCRVLANKVSAPELTKTTTTTGVALGGSNPGNPNHPLYTDAIVTMNTLGGVTIPVSLPTNTGGQVSQLRSILSMNTGSNGKVVLESEDSGWQLLSNYGTFAPGYASNSGYPARARIIREGKRTTIKFEGAISLTAEPRNNNVFFTFTDPAFIPAYDKLMGEARGVATPFATSRLSINTAGSFRTVFPSDTYTTNFTISTEVVI